jgi:putative methionine-R-sulfoxide reductase with GAF domain
MKSFFRKVSVIFVLLYIAGVALASYRIIELPELLTQTKVVNLLEVRQLMPVLEETSIFVGGTALLGLLAIVSLIVSRGGSASAEQVRIARMDSDKQKEENEQQNDQEQESETELRLKATGILEQESQVIKALNKVLASVCNELQASQGAVYLSRYLEDKRIIELKASYAYSIPDSQTVRFEFGEGLAGQVAKEGKSVNIKSVPEGYVKILSGLGSATPSNLLIIPMLNGEQVFGVVEIASFQKFTVAQQQLLEQIFAQVAEQFDEQPVLEENQVTPE